MAKNQGRRNRQRGQETERELVGLIREHFGVEHKGRNLGQERDSGPDVPLPGIGQIQVKRKRSSPLYGWLKDADLLAIRADGQGFLIVLPWTLFVRLAREEVVK